jgi:cytochrome c-type biogenesis protein CcmF
MGSVALWAAIVLAVVAAVSGRRWALRSAAVSGALSTFILGVALLAGDFSLAYVADTTSLATPWPYRLSALWGGMDGSMLFYTSMLLAVAALSLRDVVAVRTAAVIGMGLALITALLANPFVVTDIPAVDGVGLLAILQHPAMIYHPPILYLGLTVLVVPFALTAAHLLGGGDRNLWLGRVRRWFYLSWTLLTFGMAAGANWAYVELGWGGYWAWDPVENTALMPWLAATIFIHTSRVEESTGRLRRWNGLFAALPFALTVLGVYLTRSGATGSIHSFAEDPVVGRILIIAAAIAIVLAALGAWRSPAGEPWGSFRLDRNGWMALNAALLSAVLVFVSAGSAYPAFVSVYLGRTVAVDSRYFVLTVLPIALVVAASIYLALGRRLFVFAGLTAVALALAFLIAGPDPGVLLLGPAVASVLLLARLTMRHKSSPRALVSRLAHLGMAVFLVGVAGSAIGDDFVGSMRPGDTVTVAGKEVTLQYVELGEVDRYLFVRGGFDVDGRLATPEIRAYEVQALPVAEPALLAGVTEDVIVAISLLFPDGETVEVSVFVRPLVMWVWVGAIVMGLAGLAALFWRGGVVSAPRPRARAVQQPGGTTIGGGSPSPRG